MKVEYMTHSGSDLLVVNAARASFGKESQWEGDKLSPRDEKLIHYLAREKHVLPFRHPSLTLRCKAPIFVARQLGKYQVGFSWSEESRRYITPTPELYWPDRWRAKAEDVKQGSDEDKEAEWMLYYRGGWMTNEEWGKTCMNNLVDLYNEMVCEGVAPEQARMILPQNMMITWVWTGTLLGWSHMLSQRLAPDTQKETRDFAALVEDEVVKRFPVSYAALAGHNN